VTLPRLYELERYWRQHPPVGDLVAAYLGYEAPASGTGVSPVPAPPAGAGYGSLEELKAVWGSLGGKIT
jgi:hypothetical protein